MGGVEVLEGSLEGDAPEDVLLAGGVSSGAEGVEQRGEPAGAGSCFPGGVSFPLSTVTEAAAMRFWRPEN